MPSWHLIDASAVAAEHKYTFYKPGHEEIEKVRPGEVVKLIFAFESEDPKAPRAERMWVQVESVDGHGSFTGRLDNDPKWIRDIAAGDLLSFKDIHIINTRHDNDDNLVNKYLPRCFVTNRVLYEGQRVGYLYREGPDREDDSGWRITAGNESADYMNDAKNVSYVSLGAVLDRDDSILHLLEYPAGSTFERAADSEEFLPIDSGERS
jgi:hypothetical protein